MADTSIMFSELRVSNSSLPAIQPKVPKASSAYSRFLKDAPYSALSGVVVDGRIPERFQVLPRCRERRQVGTTNRWRLPEALYSDLLGNSQALKAINMPYNSTLIRIITAESPKLCTNLDANVPYVFRRSADRPHTSNHTPFGKSRPPDSMTVKLKDSYRSKSMQTLGPVVTYVPKTARILTPREIFLYHSRKSTSFVGPVEQKTKIDVLLKCLDKDWKLHRIFLHKAGVLAGLLQATDSTRRERTDPDSNPVSHRLSHSKGYSDDNPETSKGHERQYGNVSVIYLDINDPLITDRAMAIALGHLYHDDLEIDPSDAAGVLGASTIIGFTNLTEGCGNIMLKTIYHQTVCRYHLAASKHHQEQVVVACERWLELNLIPVMSAQIQLREVSLELLQKIIKSNRLFVQNEYSVYRTLTYWLFLQLNPDIQLMPSHSTILAFFNSLPKTTSFLETEEGHLYLPLFQSLRLHGITDTVNIQDMQSMNIVPQSWLIKLLSQHYHSMQGGGDMPTVRDFHISAVRQGFIVEDEPHFHSEVLSLHGFHFELKAVKENPTTNTYSIYMERLKPGDPILTFKQCERHTFSMRPDREVRYCLTAQYVSDDEYQTRSSGCIVHKFGLAEKTCCSQVLTVNDVKEPLYVSFAVFFPPS